MTACVLVSNLDASTNCGEMKSLFESAGAVMQTLTLSPAVNGAAGAALIYFAEPSQAQAAVDLFDSHPYAGCYLEVSLTDAAAATRLLLALAEVQQGPGTGQVTAATTAAPTFNSGPLAAPPVPAAPEVAFASGAAVPMPPPFSTTPATSHTTVAAVNPRNGASRAPAAAPDPPAYNPEDWLPPAEWQATPASDSASAGGGPATPGGDGGGWAAAAASSSRQRQGVPVAAAARKPAAAATAAVAAPTAAAPARGPLAELAGPEGDVDERCRIFVQGLKPGASVDAFRAYFARFGPLLDASIVPAKHMGFLEYKSGEDGQRAKQEVNGTSVPGLSDSSSGPLKLLYRSKHHINKRFASTRSDSSGSPTTRLFIGYFPRTTKLQALRAELSRYGEMSEAMLGGGEDGGDMFAHVQFKHVSDAMRAHSAIHGHSIPALAGSRQLVAGFKQPRQQQR